MGLLTVVITVGVGEQGWPVFDRPLDDGDVEGGAAASNGVLAPGGGRVEGLVAVDQEGDWINTEASDGSAVGWLRAAPTVVTPEHFPCFYRFSDSLPPDTEIRVRESPSAGDHVVGA